MAIRTSTAAGRFFPDDKTALKRVVKSCIAQTEPVSGAIPAVPRAIIAPHAGYDFSGALTAAAWQSSKDMKPARIAILSPSHSGQFNGIALPDNHNAIALPGLRVKIDGAAVASLIASGHAIPFDPAFEQEHGIDTQLPFARSLHAGVPIVPMVIGKASVDAVSATVDALAAMEGETLFVISTDLSHYLSEEDAQQRDVRTAGLIEACHPELLTHHDACGHRVLAGLLTSDLGRSLRSLRLGRYTSAHTTQDRDRVVGYGAWALYPDNAEILNDDLRNDLITLARKAIAMYLRNGKAPRVRVDSFAPPLRSVCASFVTLKLDGRLRGCIGSLSPVRPLVADVAMNAVKAGFDDVRFPKLTSSDLQRLTVQISVLTRPVPLAADNQSALLSQLLPGETGLILQDGKKRGVFLPSVWEHYREPQTFLNALRRKAGLDEKHWSDSLTVHAFRVEHFGQPKQPQSEAA